MNGGRRRPAFLLMAAFSLALAWSVPPAAAQSLDERLAAVIGKNEEERREIYGQLSFPAGNLRVGQVLSAKPLAVVAAVGRMDTDGYAAEIRVWTGLAQRSGDHLIAVWDSIWVDEAGKPESVFVMLAKEIRDYFKAGHQMQFRTADYAGIYPWADIPTDAEAAGAERDPLPSDGMLDLYGYGGSIERSAAKTDLLPAVPSVIGDRPAFRSVPVDREPPDIAGHWARAYILSLMRIGVISGYEDGTIRPDRTLGRAEFVKLLVDAIRAQPAPGDTGYADLRNHWSAPYVKAAIDAGIVPAGGGASFRPNESVSRAEMAVLLERALAGRMLLEDAAPSAFTDVARLSEKEVSAVETAARFGLISGFPDGTFRPAESLTRAQGFTVISKLIELW